MPPEFDGRVPETDMSKTEIPKMEGSGFPEIDNFLDDEKVKNNKEIIIKVLNKIGNEHLKQWLKNFVLTEKNIIKVNGYKLKLSQATDENTIEDIIRRIIPEWFKIWDKKVEINLEDESEVENSWDLGDNLWQTLRDEKNAEEDKKNAEEDKKNAEEDLEKERAQQLRYQALSQRIELAKKDPDLINRTKKDSEKYNSIRDQLSANWVLSQLNQKWFDEQFIVDYITIQATFQEVKNNSNYTEEEISTFDKIVKNLNNACKIPDTNLDSFSKDNIGQTRTELFDTDIWNKSLIEARKNNIESHEGVYNEIFSEMWEDEMFTKYWKFLEWDSKVFWLQYQTNSDIRNKIANEKNNPTEENKQLLESYNKMYAETLKIKGVYDTKTKDMMEELCIISQIKWMYMCMWEWDNFNLNKSREIRLDEEWAMILDGHIDGIDFSIRQDINNPQAKLQTSQKLAKNGNAFVIGWEDNFEDSNFILPSQNEIFNSITEIVKSDSIKSLENFDTSADYFEYLQTTIMWNMEEKYKDTEYVHNYMKEQVKWEKIVNNVLLFIGEIDPNIIDGESGKNITQEGKKDLYDFMKILKFNIDNSTDLEKDHFSRCITEIERIIDNYKTTGKCSGIYFDEISGCLENNEWIAWTPEERLKLIFRLFNHFNENSSDNMRVDYEWNDGIQTNMIINDLYIQLHDKPNEAKEQQKRDQKSDEEHNTAENVLNLGDSSLWPSEPTVSMA